MITLVEKIVNSNVNGTILILPIILLIKYVGIPQAKDCIRTYKRILREEGVFTSK